MLEILDRILKVRRSPLLMAIGLLGVLVVLLAQAYEDGFVWDRPIEQAATGPSVYVTWDGMDELQERLGTSVSDIAVHVALEPTAESEGIVWRRELHLRSTRAADPLRLEGVEPGRYVVRMRMAPWVTAVRQYQQPWMELGEIEVTRAEQRQEFELSVPSGVIP